MNQTVIHVIELTISGLASVSRMLNRAGRALAAVNRRLEQARPVIRVADERACTLCLPVSMQGPVMQR